MVMPMALASSSIVWESGLTAFIVLSNLCFIAAVENGQFDHQALNGDRSCTGLGDIRYLKSLIAVGKFQLHPFALASLASIHDEFGLINFSSFVDSVVVVENGLFAAYPHDDPYIKIETATDLEPKIEVEGICEQIEIP